MSKYVLISKRDEEDLQLLLPLDHPVLKKLSKRIKPRSAKNKGAALQKFVCQELSEMLSLPYNQGDDECLIHSREMGQPGTDVVLRGEARKRFPYSVECKNTESLSLTDTILQAEANRAEGTEWLIVHKRKALSEPVVILSWSAFRALFARTQ